MKRYIKAETISVNELSKERLENIVSEIVNVINTPQLGETKRILQIIRILEFYNLK